MEIEELTDMGYDVMFVHTNCYGQRHVTCMLRPSSKKRLGFLSLDDGSDDAECAFIKCCQLLKESNSYGYIRVPTSEEQNTNHGYCRRMLRTKHECEFNLVDGFYYITRFRLKDCEGFYYLEQPFELPDSYKFVKSTEDAHLYSWDDISCLSGSRGFAKVVCGLVVRTKTTAIG